MKAFVPKVISALFVAMSLISCLPDREYLYTDTGMCTRIGFDRLQTDAGAIYNITENNSGANIPDSVKRVMISCDVTSEVPGKTNEYNIRLIDFRSALCEEPVIASFTPVDTLGTDGIRVAQAWVSGGYLNSFLYVTMKRNSDTAHSINVLFDDIKSNSDTLYLTMRHNAYGESPENPEQDLNYLVLAGVYASFPLNGVMPVGGSSPIVHLEWDWYIEDGASITREKAPHTGNLKVE